MNIKLLRKIQKAILKYPNHFDMDNWFMDTNMEDDNDDIIKLVNLNGGTCEKMITPRAKSCGTTACIAGWALHYNKVKLEDFEGNIDFVRSTTEKTAARELGLDEEQSKRLFFESYWPREFRYLESFESKEDTAFRAAARIDHFIATGGEE